MSWDTPFDDPVPGLRTLREAADHILSRPKAEQELPHWQAAVEAVMVVAEHDGDTMLARIGMLRAINRGKPVPDQPRRKIVKVYELITSPETQKKAARPEPSGPHHSDKGRDA
jgi:hypothetical protein